MIGTKVTSRNTVLILTGTEFAISQLLQVGLKEIAVSTRRVCNCQYNTADKNNYYGQTDKDSFFHNIMF